MTTEAFVLTEDIGESIRRMVRDMRFVGWYFIIAGGLTCLGIITAIIGVPMLIAGLRLRESADKFQNYRTSGDLQTLHQALDKQRSFFFLSMLYITIGLIFAVLYLVVIFFFLASFGFDALSEMGTEVSL